MVTKFLKYRGNIYASFFNGKNGRYIRNEKTAIIGLVLYVAVSVNFELDNKSGD